MSVYTFLHDLRNLTITDLHLLQAKEKIVQANQIDIFDAAETGNTADVLLLITVYPEKINMPGGVPAHYR